MPTLSILGHDVEVGEEFTRLSPDDQQKFVNQLASQLPGRADRTRQAAEAGVASGMFFGFPDELRGLMAAGGIDPSDPAQANALRTVVSLGVGGYKKLTGDLEAQKAYDEEVAKAREEASSLQAQHPYAYGAGQVGGALTVPISAGARAATLGGRALASAITGAGVGALTGFGEGEGLPASAKGAAIGGVLGAGVGAAAPAIVEPLGRFAGQVLQPVTNRIRGLINPEQEAARRIGAAATADLNAPAGRRGLSAADYAAELAAGNPVATIDRLGPAGASLARSAANTSPEARAELEQLAQERYAGTGERLANWLRGAFHYPNADAQRIALEEASRATNSANYRAAMAAGDRPIWSPELERLTSAPPVEAALAAAAKSGKTRAVLGGQGGFNSPVTVTPDGRVIFNRGATGVPTYPNLEFWDAARRRLSDAAGAAFSAGRRTEGTELNDLAQALNAALDQQVSGYEAARAGAAHFFGQRDMLSAGEAFVGAAQRYGIPETRRALASATPQERQLFQDGYASRLIQQLEAKGGAARTNMLNRIDQSPAAQEELALGLGGRDRADAFRARMRVESVMGRMRTALGNSTTARQLAELGLAGGAGAVDYFGFGGDLFHAAGAGGVAAGLGMLLRVGGRQAGVRIDQRVVERVGQMLASPDHTVVERGIQIIRNNDGLRRALAAADNVAARAGAGATTSASTQGRPAEGRGPE